MQDINAFTAMTWDRIPAQCDESLANKIAFGTLTVQGGVTSGISNACVAVDLSGRGTLLLDAALEFKKAPGVGEEITSSAEMASIRDDQPNCMRNVSVRDENGDNCVKGAATSCTVPLEGL